MKHALHPSHYRPADGNGRPWPSRALADGSEAQCLQFPRLSRQIYAGERPHTRIGPM